MQTVRAAALMLALVPGAAHASYTIDLRTTPTVSGARLRIAVKPPGSAANVRQFTIAHEHPLHLFVVGEGLEFFAHVHPAPQPDGVFMADLTLPRPGPYMAILAFEPEGAAPQMHHQAFTTGVAFGRVARPPVDPLAKEIDGMRISLDASAARAGEAQPVVVRVEDAATGAPITDLEPHLGAGGHLFAVSPDASEAAYDHPQPEGRGPALTFRPLFPRAGLFKLWIQVQRGGRVITASYVIAVASSQ